MDNLIKSRDEYKEYVIALIKSTDAKMEDIEDGIDIFELTETIEELVQKKNFLEILDSQIQKGIKDGDMTKTILQKDTFKLPLEVAIKKYRGHLASVTGNLKEIEKSVEKTIESGIVSQFEKNSNRFSESKNFIQSIADVSLMMANISQLRAVLGFGDANRFYIHLLILVMLSLVSHMFFVFFTVIRSHFLRKHHIALNRAKSDIEKQQTKDKQTPTSENDNSGITNVPKIIAEPQTENKERKVTFCCCCSKDYRGNEYTSSDLCQCPHCHTDLYLGYICNILVFITICANIGITGIGIS